MKEKLINILIAAASFPYGMDSRSEIELLADYLIKNGVIVLPCKVGTPVFIINKKGQIFPGKFRLDDIDQFGKRVFLTRSEAEAALKPKINKVVVLNSFMKGAEQ